MDVYMGYLKLQVYTRLLDKSVLFESAGSEDRRPNWWGRRDWSWSSNKRCRLSETILRCVRLKVGSERLKPILKEPMSFVWNHPAMCLVKGGVEETEANPQRTDVVCLKPSYDVSGFNRTDFALRPSAAKETGNGPPKDTSSFHLRHYPLWISPLEWFSQRSRRPKQSDIERRYA